MKEAARRARLIGEANSFGGVGGGDGHTLIRRHA
eukprot:CAMPEP_0181125482 /NCGR_PEP_ID=MMETSP1071-20121207/27077_1 /TAXON_ID=35127 /ORGANISM="Thalassiosira sp., Strain NH16" /LENGTH=33 /DNA_ID= /DNA_START= /DNA_END= /DNA_ORIENTATION=